MPPRPEALELLSAAPPPNWPRKASPRPLAWALKEPAATVAQSRVERASFFMTVILFMARAQAGGPG